MFRQLDVMWFDRREARFNRGYCCCIDENETQIKVFSVESQDKFWVDRDQIDDFSGVFGIGDEGDLIVCIHFAATMGWCEIDE